MDLLDQTDSPPSPAAATVQRPVATLANVEPKTVESTPLQTIAKATAELPESSEGSLASAILPDDDDDEIKTTDRSPQPLQTRTVSASPLGASGIAATGTGTEGGAFEPLGSAVDSCTGPSPPGSCSTSFKAAVGSVGGILVLVALLVLGFCLYKRRRSYRRDPDHRMSTA